MTCIKTGCVVYLEQYGEWIYGDAFVHDDVLVIRAVWRSRDLADMDQLGNVRHFTVQRVAQWWDESQTSMKQNSTLISSSGDWHQNGDYEGITEPRLAAQAPA